MSIASFFSKLFLHAASWAVLLYGLLAPAHGYENLAVFALGMISVMGLISTIVSGGVSSLDVPGSFFGKLMFRAFQISSALLVFILAEHGHFVAATLMTLMWFVRQAAYREVRMREKAFKEILKEAAARFDEFDEQIRAGKEVEQPAFGTKATTAQVNVNPNAARDPAFGYPFTPSDIAATSA
jgi:hypothetical protein